MLKYDSDVFLVVVMCKLFVVTILLCANPSVSVKLKSSTTLLEKLGTSFHSKYEYQINDTIESTESISNMDINDKNRSTVVDNELYSDWWSRDIWSHLHEKSKSDSNDTHNNPNNDEFNYDYYYDYDEFLPSYNESTLKEYENWKNYWSSHLKQLAYYPDKNKTVGDNIETPLHTVPHNITGNLSTSSSLKDIIVHYYLNGLIGNNINHTEDFSHSTQMPINHKYPPWENLTSEEKLHMVKRVQGDPQRYSNATAIGLTTYYGVLLAVGIPGNGLTILIILTNSYMRTAPNFFLLNIAMADLVTLTMVVPLEVKMLFKSYPWPWGEVGCDIATTICELVTHVLIVTMIAFSLERYFAICHPLKPSLQSGKGRTVFIIVLIWVGCLIPSVLWSLYSKVEYMFYSRTDNPKSHIIKSGEERYLNQGYVKVEESAMCVVSPSSVSSTMAAMAVLTTFFLYILPILILPLIYWRIAQALKESENYSCALTRNANFGRNRRTVVRMQMAVIFCFLICWTPYHVQRMMFVFLTKFDAWTPELANVQNILHLVSGCCYFLSSAINPFLYSLLSKRFRRGFQDIKHKLLSNWQILISRNSSSADNRNTRPTPKKFSTLPNNYSFRFNNKKVQSRNALKRHFELVSSSIVKLEDKPQGLELEMQSIAHEANQSVKASSSTLSGLPVTLVDKDHQRIADLKKHDVERIACMLKCNKNERLKCKYKVLFKTRSNTDTTVIVNPSMTKKETCKPNIPRCTRMSDLRNVGTLSSVVYITGHKSKQGYTSYNSIAEEKIISTRIFSTSSCLPSSKEV